MSIAQLQGVQPTGGVAVGVEGEVVKRVEAIAVVALVLDMAEFQAAAPGIQQLGLQVTGDTGKAEALAGVARVEAEEVVVLGLAALIEQVETAFQALIEAMLQAQVEGLAA